MSILTIQIQGEREELDALWSALKEDIVEWGDVECTSATFVDDPPDPDGRPGMTWSDPDAPETQAALADVSRQMDEGAERRRGGFHRLPPAAAADAPEDAA